MEKNEFRVFINHYYLRGKMAKGAKAKLDKYYGTSAHVRPQEATPRFMVSAEDREGIITRDTCMYDKRHPGC